MMCCADIQVPRSPFLFQYTYIVCLPNSLELHGTLTTRLLRLIDLMSSTQLKLINHDEGNSSGPPKSSSTTPAKSPAPALAAHHSSAVLPVTNAAKSPANQISPISNLPRDSSGPAYGRAGSEEDTVAAVSPSAVAGAEGKGGGVGGEVGRGEGERDQELGEAMIDEAEYTEDHHEEQKLFEGMQELLTVRSWLCTHGIRKSVKCAFLSLSVGWETQDLFGKGEAETTVFASFSEWV